MTILACVLAAGIRWHAARRQAAAVDALGQMGYSQNYVLNPNWYGVGMLYDFQVSRTDGYDYEADPKAPSPIPRWLLNLAGVDFFHTLTAVRFPDASTAEFALPQLKSLPRLRHVVITCDSLHDVQYLTPIRAALPGVDVESEIYIPQWIDPWPIRESGSSQYPDWLPVRRGVSHAQQQALELLAEVVVQYNVDTAGWVTAVRFVGEHNLYPQRAVRDADLVHLGSFPHLERVGLRDCRITDAGLAHLSQIRSLKTLVLAGTLVTDEGLQHIAPLTNLIELDLDDTRITEYGLQHVGQLKKLELLNALTKTTSEGVGHLAGLTELRELTLGGVYITDAAVPALACLKNLKQLDISRTDISINGYAELKRALPQCVIQHVLED